jgi:hypothetical protein
MPKAFQRAIVIALWGSLLWLAAPLVAHGQDTVPAAEALKELQTHADVIAARRAAADKMYGETLGGSMKLFGDLAIAGAEKRVALDDLRKDHARHWGRNFSSLGYTGTYEHVYKFHAAAIEASMANIRYVGSTRRDKLQAIKDGMAAWAEHEKAYLERIAKAVELMIDRVEANGRLAVEDAKACAGAACEQKRAAVREATAKYDKASDAFFAAERKLKEDFGKHFFEAIDMLRVRLDVRDTAWRQGWRKAKQEADEDRERLDRIEAELAKSGAAFQELAKDESADGDQQKRIWELRPKLDALWLKMLPRILEIEKEYKASPNPRCRDAWDCIFKDAQIDKLGRELGPLAKRSHELSKVHEAYLARLAAARDKLELDVAHRDEAQREYSKRLDKLIAALRKNVIERVDVLADGELVHQVTFDSSDAEWIAKLLVLETARSSVEALAKEAKRARDAAWKEFFRQQNAAVAAGEELRSAILKNALGQAAVELVGNLWDVAQAGRKGGWWGVAVEVVVKVGEGVTKILTDEYGPDTFDAVNPKSIADQISAQLQADLADPAALQQLGKTAITAGSQELISNRAKKIGMALKSETGDHRSALARIKGALEKVEKRREAVEGLAQTVIKEIVKTGFQKYFNNIEIDAWTKFFNHAIRARQVFPYFQMADAAYRDADAILARLDAEKEAFLKEHAGDHTLKGFWRTKVDRPVNPKAVMTVKVHLKQPAESVKVDVLFARHDTAWRQDGTTVHGMKASAQGDNTFTYTLPAQQRWDIPIQVNAAKD